jgi:hypothetical protein
MSCASGQLYMSFMNLTILVAIAENSLPYPLTEEIMEKAMLDLSAGAKLVSFSAVDRS